MITSVVEHNRSSVLRGRIGKEHSKDMVGDSVRELIEENIAKYDPFGRERSTKYVYVKKPRHGLYQGLTESQFERFIDSKRREFMRKFV